MSDAEEQFQNQQYISELQFQNQQYISELQRKLEEAERVLRTASGYADELLAEKARSIEVHKELIELQQQLAEARKESKRLQEYEWMYRDLSQ